MGNVVLLIKAARTAWVNEAKLFDRQLHTYTHCCGLILQHSLFCYSSQKKSQFLWFFHKKSQKLIFSGTLKCQELECISYYKVMWKNHKKDNNWLAYHQQQYCSDFFHKIHASDHYQQQSTSLQPTQPKLYNNNNNNILIAMTIFMALSP